MESGSTIGGFQVIYSLEHYSHGMLSQESRLNQPHTWSEERDLSPCETLYMLEC